MLIEVFCTKGCPVMYPDSFKIPIQCDYCKGYDTYWTTDECNDVPEGFEETIESEDE